MSKISLLSQKTIDQIAAGEVVERPSSIVKELVENAIDAHASAITVEIKDGGISLIRITDNGGGIERDEVRLAFLRHSTSKIRDAADLMSVHSLGFRGEALSSISAVSRVELITKTPEALTGVRYILEGGKEISFEEIGAPDGTTFLVRDIFYNTPARRKFLKTPQTEGSYISDMLEKLALSHPEISFKYINNNQTRLHTSGNGSTKDNIYHIYGRDIASALLPVDYEGEHFKVTGLIGKPVINRGNRNYENYFINGRYVKSTILSKSIEEAYRSFLMQHQYPFCVLYFTFPDNSLDVNVHPTKMELRFGNGMEISRELCEALKAVLSHKEMIPEVPVAEEKKPVSKPVIKESLPEPFERQRIRSAPTLLDIPVRKDYPKPQSSEPVVKEEITFDQPTLDTLSPTFLTESAKRKHRIIGQLFATYWLVEYEDKLYIIDQHAAHEKVLYERTMATLAQKDFTSQQISPPIMISLDAREEEGLKTILPELNRLGYSIDNFGGREYMINAVPANLFSIDGKELFIEMLGELSEDSVRRAPDLILEKVASMSCKAAVKGSSRLSFPEIDALIGELLTLENPFNCPHGRPTIISMSKYDIEKKFKRIV